MTSLFQFMVATSYNSIFMLLQSWNDIISATLREPLT